MMTENLEGKSKKTGEAPPEFDEQNLGQLVYNALSEYFEQHDGILPAPGLYKRILIEIERPLFFLALRAVLGNQQKAAQMLGIHRNTLRKKLKELMQTREGKEILKSFTASSDWEAL
jgi:two-component system nitrogen regulation response regulator GlnG